MPDLLKSIPLALVCFVALSACRREPPVEHSVATPATSTTAKSASSHWAGHYRCAGHCSGIDHAVELQPDGRYIVSGHVPALSDARGIRQGRWALEPSRRQLRLVPDDNRQPEQLYDIISDHELAYVGNDSTAIDLAYTLRRAAD